MDAILEADASGGSATSRAYQQLRRQILTGQRAPSAKLKVDELKDDLQIGASPIREALSLLTSDQLVERIDQRGFRVAPVSAVQFREVLKLRCSLEDMALRESLAAADEGWEEALVLAHHRLSRTAREDVDVFEELHKAFHMALLAACPSPLLMRFCNRLYDLNIRYRYLAGRSTGYAAKRDVAGEHSQILQAALDRDAGLASQRLLEHYSMTGAFLALQMDALEAQGASQ